MLGNKVGMERKKLKLKFILPVSAFRGIRHARWNLIYANEVLLAAKSDAHGLWSEGKIQLFNNLTTQDGILLMQRGMEC